MLSIAGEHAFKSIAEVASHRGEKTVLDHGVRAPSQSVGAAEQSHNLLSSQIRFPSTILGEHSKLSWT